eukprot:736178-Pleurochrysis_carterae.AAC.3
MASRTSRMQSPSVRCDVQIYGLTRLATVWQIHRLARIVRARLGLGRRSPLRQWPVRRYRRARVFEVRLSRACAFKGARVK